MTCWLFKTVPSAVFWSVSLFGSTLSARQNQQLPAASAAQTQPAPPNGHESQPDSSNPPGAGGGIFHIGRACSENDPPPCSTPPRAILAPEPTYTDQARKAKLEGVCTLGVRVEADGNPSHIRVLKRLGMGLDDNAVEALKTWKFKPAMRYEQDMKDGHPIASEIAIEVDFRLRQGPRPTPQVP